MSPVAEELRAQVAERLKDDYAYWFENVAYIVDKRGDRIKPTVKPALKKPLKRRAAAKAAREAMG